VLSYQFHSKLSEISQIKLMKSRETKPAPNNEPMSLEESFHNCYFRFIEAVSVLALDAAEQCKVMGHVNVAWEIQHDVLDGGISLINWPVDHLSQPEKDAIAQVTTPLKELPDDALLNDSVQAMNHPSWVELRLAATRLIAQLEDATKKNRQFFDSQS
jgi:hypothetical protein